MREVVLYPSLSLQLDLFETIHLMIFEFVLRNIDMQKKQCNIQIGHRQVGVADVRRVNFCLQANVSCTLLPVVCNDKNSYCQICAGSIALVVHLQLTILTDYQFY